MGLEQARLAGYAAVAAAVALGAAAVVVGLRGGTPAVRTQGGGLPAAVSGLASPLPGRVFPSEQCSPVLGPGQAWPEAFVAAVPRVAGAVMGRVERGGGTLAIEFTVPANFVAVGEGVRASLPAASLAVVGGDAEAREIDTRFLGGDLTGGIKVIATGSCTTRGILAVVDSGATGAPSTPLPASLLPLPVSLPFASAGLPTP